MTSWAKVGAKCVCVDDTPMSIIPLKSGLSVGTVYTIEHVNNGPLGVRLLLAEVPYPSLGKATVQQQIDMNLGFGVHRFRPLVSKTQSEDVAMFLELLQKQGEPA